MEIIVLDFICSFFRLAMIYSNKSLIVYAKVEVENVKQTTMQERGRTTVFLHPQNVERTYQDNYASIGGAVAFGLIAAASLIGLALLLCKDVNVPESFMKQNE